MDSPYQRYCALVDAAAQRAGIDDQANVNRIFTALLTRP